MTEPIDSEIRDLLALQLVSGVGSRLTAALLEQFGSAAAVLAATPEQLQEIPYVSARIAAAIKDPDLQRQVDEELSLISEHQVHLWGLGQPDYPASLVLIPDVPHLLYLKGMLRPEDANAVGVVGTRKPTPYGKRVAEKLAAGLTRAGHTVVSGMAYGIDAIAHRAALQAGGRTLAVLAGGLTRIYPRDHLDLAREIAANGALITEFCMRQEPLGGLFLVRNRIISGLSRAVVIVEAAERSGALSTASHAAEQGRPVLVVPGPIESEQSGGCHDLIRKGAVLCRGVDDVLEELDGLGSTPVPRSESKPPPSRQPPPGMDEVQRRVWDFLGDQSRSLDEMAQQLGLAVPRLSGVLMGLEMKKAVRRLPGSRYERS